MITTPYDNNGVNSNIIKRTAINDSNFLFCLSDIDECAVNPCYNVGTMSCMNLVNDFECLCLTGFTGLGCETGEPHHRNIKVIILPKTT